MQALLPVPSIAVPGVYHEIPFVKGGRMAVHFTLDKWKAHGGFSGCERLRGAGVLRGQRPLSRPKAVLQAGARRAQSLRARSKIRDMPLALISQGIKKGGLPLT